MCILNHVGVPIFCPTTSHTTAPKKQKKQQKKAACLFCYFKVQICANSGLPVLLEAAALFQEMPKNGLWPHSLICSEYVFKIPDRKCAFKGPEYAIFYLPLPLFLQLITQLRKGKHSGYLARPSSLI